MSGVAQTITLHPDNWVAHLAQIAAQSPDGDTVNVWSNAQRELLERALVRLERSPDALVIHVITEDEIQ